MGLVNTTEGSGVARRGKAGVGLAWGWRGAEGCQVMLASRLVRCVSRECRNVPLLLPPHLPSLTLPSLMSPSSPLFSPSLMLISFVLFFPSVLMYFLTETLVMSLQAFCDLFILPIHSCLASLPSSLHSSSSSLSSVCPWDGGGPGEGE